MNSKYNTGIVLAVVALSLGACGDEPNTGFESPLVPELASARVPAQCSTSELASAARGFFSTPLKQDVTALLRDMETACADGSTGAAVDGGWNVLSLIEGALETGVDGDADDGVALANGLLAFMNGVDASLAIPPDPVLPAAFGDQGIFAVRGDDARDIVARGPVDFTDFDGLANDALWGLETSTTWSQATGASHILIYGQPTAASGLPLAEVSFGDLGYALSTFPDVDRFADGELHVAVCYANDVALPHEQGDESLPTLAERMQREGTILQKYEAGCGDWRATLARSFTLGGALDGVLALAERAFAPRPLHAAFLTDRRAPSTGGSPLDFSDFAPVAALRSGRLVFVTPPTNGNAGVPFENVQVQALSGSGTPMELVTVQLYVAGNQGQPAGATFCDPAGPADQDCDDTAITEESLDGSGSGTLATFDAATLYKPGGYTICARALDSQGSIDFSFAEACGEMVNLKN